MSEAVAAPAVTEVAPVAPGTDSAKPAETVPQATPPKPETPAEKEIVRFKANGKMVEFTKDELIRRASKDFAGDEKLAAAAAEKKRISQMLKVLESDDGILELAKAMGRDPDALLENHLKRRQELAAMTPEQREIAELRAEKARIEQEKAELAQKQEAEQRQAVEKQVWAKVEAEAMSVLDKVDLGGMGKAEALYLLADAAEASLAHDLDLTPEELAAEVQSRIDASRETLANKMRKGLTGDKLLTHLGQDVVNAVLQAAIARLKGGQKIVPPKPEVPGAPKSETSSSAEALAKAAMASEFF